MISRELTKRETVLLVVLAVIVISLGYVKLVLTPINEQVESYQSMKLDEEIKKQEAETKVIQIRKMEKSIENAKKSGKAHPIPEYDSSVALGVELQNIFAGTVDYMLDFDDVEIEGMIVKRPVTMSFQTNTYEEATAVIRALHDSAHVNQISDVSITASEYKGKKAGTGLVKSTVVTTFFEIKK